MKSKKYNKLDLFLIKRRNKNRLPVGSKVIVKECERFPKGTLAKILSHNTYECEYQITTVLESKSSGKNPYILEHEDGLKVTQEEFDTAEFISYDLVEAPIYKIPHPVVSFITGTFGLLTVGALLFLSGALIALEFVK